MNSSWQHCRTSKSEILQEHVTDDNVLLEVLICGTHLGPWRGLPATGRRVEIPLCGVYTFDDQDRLAGERIYYDRASVLRQLGVFREPQTLVGRIGLLVNHPLTIARALFRSVYQLAMSEVQAARRRPHRVDERGQVRPAGSWKLVAGTSHDFLCIALSWWCSILFPAVQILRNFFYLTSRNEAIVKKLSDSSSTTA